MDARVPQSPGDQFDTTIMAVEPHFPQQHAGTVGEVCARSVFSRGVVGSFVARMLESYAQFSAKQNRSATAAAAFALSVSGRSDWAMKIRRHCSMPPHPFKAPFRIFGRGRIGESPMGGDGTRDGESRARLRPCRITKRDNHIPRQMLNRGNAFAVEVLVGDAMLSDRGQSKRVWCSGGAASSRARLQLSREEVQGQRLRPSNFETLFPCTDKQQTQRGHVCHCA